MLEPLLFSVYVSDLPEGFESYLNMFANDPKLRNEEHGDIEKEKYNTCQMNGKWNAAQSVNNKDEKKVKTDRTRLV